MSTASIVFLVLGIVFAMVVMVAFLIGAALLMPAMSQARAAKSVQFKNDLKQIAIAMYNYADTHRMFPAGGTYTKKDEPYHAWMTSLLPFIDQASLCNTIDFDQPWTTPKNQQAFESLIPGYRNPNVSPENMAVGSLGGRGVPKICLTNTTLLQNHYCPDTAK